MLWGAWGGCMGDPPLHHSGSPGLTAHTGLETALGSRLWHIPKHQQSPGRGPGGCGAGPALLPLVSGIQEARFQGWVSPGGQRQDRRRRRILLSGCFLKITLPLSAGQGCSRLNNRSRPALPCSRALAGSTNPGCWTTAPSPASLSPGAGHDALHPPNPTSLGFGGHRGSCRRN